MPDIRVLLKNCYGIGELKRLFHFDSGKNIRNNTKSYAIYASNGLMKSSFTKTFYAVQEKLKNEPRDIMYPEKKPSCKIKWDSKDIEPDNIYVVKSFVELPEEPAIGVTRLLVNNKLKKNYDELYNTLDKQKIDIMMKLKKISKSTDCELEITKTFNEDLTKNIYEILSDITSGLKDKQYVQYSFRYNDVFDKNGKVKNFVLQYKDLLQEYAKTYDRLLSSSDFFSKDSSFGTYQANKLQNDIKGGEFFNAGHKFKLKSLGHDIQSQEEFSNVVKEEINRIISDKDAQNAFNEIDKVLQNNQDLRKFQAVLSKDNTIAAKLVNYDQFKIEVWYGFLSQVYGDLYSLVESYKKAKPKLDEIMNQASVEQKLWKNATSEFNRRFSSLPFRLTVSNQKDVILSKESPTIEFNFDDGSGSKKATRKELATVLSVGEQRALYLLNVIFDVEARKADGKETIFIFDDIVDSFDYKNKYAIVQYLKDIANVDNFYQIILTHNFDFFRTIVSRGIVEYKACMTACKDDGVVKLNKVKNNLNNPFLFWETQLARDSTKLIASIPFARNIIEYTQGKNSDDYMTLTKMLHIKKDSLKLKIKELNQILSRTFDNINLPEESPDSIYKIVIDNAENCLRKTGELELDGKVVLSMASRLLAERYMMNKLSNESLEKLKNQSNQTSGMVELYKSENQHGRKDVMDMLDDILLKTPENIHLNAFMYEPIIDLGSEELKDLFRRAKAVFSTNKS